MNYKALCVVLVLIRTAGKVAHLKVDSTVAPIPKTSVSATNVFLERTNLVRNPQNMVGEEFLAP